MIFILSLLVNVFLVLKDLGFLGDLGNFGEKDLKRQVVRVMDGDTFDTNQDERVRLAGAEAPEYPKGCLSNESRLRLEELILGQEVVLEKINTDSFGRIIAFVFSDSLFIDKALIDEGLARAASGSHPRYGVELLSAEEAAQKAERGIWSEACVNPQSGCIIKGNVRTDKDTKIYHLPECFNYERIVLKEREGDCWFCSEKEAQTAGFRKSEDCPIDN